MSWVLNHFWARIFNPKTSTSNGNVLIKVLSHFRPFLDITLTRNAPSLVLAQSEAVSWPVSFVRWRCRELSSFVVTTCISFANTVDSKRDTRTWAFTCHLVSGKWIWITEIPPGSSLRILVLVTLKLAMLWPLVNADHSPRQWNSTY